MNTFNAEKTFAMRIRQHREARGWSQSKLANRVAILAARPMDQATIGRIEKGTRHVGLNDAVDLARALNMQIADLLVELKCEVCKDLPPVGFICQACGAYRREVKRDEADTATAADRQSDPGPGEV